MVEHGVTEKRAEERMGGGLAVAFISILTVILMGTVSTIVRSAFVITESHYPLVRSSFILRQEITALQLQLNRPGVDGDPSGSATSSEEWLSRLETISELSYRVESQAKHLDVLQDLWSSFRQNGRNIRTKTRLARLERGMSSEATFLHFSRPLLLLLADIESIESQVHLDAKSRIESNKKMLAIIVFLLVAMAGGAVIVIRRYSRRHEQSHQEILAEQALTERRVVIRTKELIEREAFVRTVVDSLVDAVISIDRWGSITSVNQAVTRLFGYDSKELLGHNIKILMPEPDRSRHDGYLDDYVKTGVRKIIGFGRNVQGLRKDGTVFPMSLSVSEVQTEGERYFTGVIRDISAQVASETALRESEELMATAFEHMSDGFAIFDSDGVLVRANRRLSGLYPGISEAFRSGAPYRSILEAALAEKLFPDAVGCESAWLGEELESWRSQERTYQRQLSDGRWIRGTDCLLPRGGHVSIRTDISTLMKAQENLKTAKVTAEEANRMKSTFLANMSHEIRTPMNAVIGLSHLALQRSENPKQKDYLKKIHGAAKSLLGIINDILDFSKSESGKMTVEAVEFSLDDLFSSLADLVSNQAEEKSLEFLIARSPSVPDRLIGDPLRLKQVLLNLCSNALKFTARGEVVVTVTSVGVDKSDQATLEFVVTDTGMGMNPNQLKSLFTAFNQADASTTREFGGTGLGLAISQQLVNLMGGEIVASSVPGEGSAFTFTIDVGLVVGADGSMRGGTLQELEGKRALVVDDNPTACNILRDLLERFGMDVEGELLPKVALSRYQEARVSEHPFDVVLLDWRMPEMDGLELARKICATTPDAAPTLVMVTAHNRDDALVEAKAAGIAATLTKPITPSTLLDTLLDVRGTAFSTQDIGGRRDAESVSPLGLGGADILLVEDNTLNQQVASEFLRQMGLEVTVAENGAEAVASLDRADWSLILMDLQMPLMDGFEATRQIRATPGYEDLPIVAMTANAMAGDRDRCIAAGMNDHLAKPIDPDALAKMVQKWVDPTEPSKASAPASSAEQVDVERPLGEMRRGVDLQEMTWRLGGSRVLVERMSSRYLEEHHGAAEHLRQIAEGPVDEDGLRFVHTIKGLVGTMGAARLAALVQRLEVRLESDTPGDLGELLADLSEEFALVEQTFRDLVGRGAEVSEAPDVASEGAGVEEILSQLEAALAEGDPIAEELVRHLEPSLSKTEHPKLARKLVTLVDNFDFDGALKLMDEIRDALKS